MIVTTTPTIEGHSIKEYKGLVSGEVIFGGRTDSYEKAELKAHLFCGGVNDPREIAGNPKLREAYELGKNV